MPRVPSSPAQLHGRVFCGSRERLLTRAQLRGSAWRRLHPDVYAGVALDALVRTGLVQHDVRRPPPVAQHTVRDAEGRFVARVDFAWPEHRLAVEHEGVRHGEPQNVVRDRARLNRLTAAGWRVVIVTAADVRRPAQLLSRIAAALTASTSA